MQVGRETVGVSEACSGIRSLQVTWMSAWFLGELHRFRFSRRLLLVGCGIAIALLCNLGRTCLLAWISFSQGAASMEKWHDSVGLAVLALSLGSLWALSTALSPARNGAADPNPAPAANRVALRPWPRQFLIALACWLLCVLVGAETWFRCHEIRRPASRHWGVDWPATAQGFKEIEIPSRTRSMLKYTEGRNASWAGDNGGIWTVFHFRWAPGRTSAALAQGHKPEICLPSIGCLLQREEGTEIYTAQSFALPFRHLLFDHGGHPLHVWWCLWDDAHEEGKKLDADTSRYRKIFRAVLRGERNLGQQVLEIALSGADNSESARAEMQRMLPRLIILRQESQGAEPIRGQ